MQEENRVVQEKQGLSRSALAWLAALPGLVYLLVFEGIPAFMSLIISFKDYTMFKGVFGSPAAPHGGMWYYEQFFTGAYFGRLLRNTLVQNVVSIALIFVVAFALVWCISHLPRRNVRIAALCVVAIPFFVPMATLAGCASMAFSSYLNRPEYYVPIYCLLQTVKNVAVPVVIGVALCERCGGFRAGRVAAALGICALVSAAFLFSADVEANALLYQPMTYEWADTIDTYTYRSGIVDGSFSLGCAAWVVKSVLQILTCVGAFFLFDRFSRRMGKAEANAAPAYRAPLGKTVIAWVGYALLAVGMLLLLLPMLTWDASPLPHASALTAQIWLSLGNSLIYGVAGGMLTTVLAALLAYPLLLPERYRRSRRVYGIVLAVFAAIAFNRVGVFLFGKTLGAESGLFVVLAGAAPVIPAFALAACMRGKLKGEMPDFAGYLRAALWPLVVIALLQFVVSSGAFFLQMILLQDQGQLGIAALVRKLAVMMMGSEAAIHTSAAEGNVARLAMLLSAIFPVLAGVAALILDRIKNKVSAFGSRLG